MAFERQPRTLRSRYLAIYALLAIFAALFVWRAYELAIHPPLPPGVQGSPPPIRRGTIFDSLQHELAVSRDKISVAIRPLEIVDPEKTAFLLARSLPGLSRDDVLARIRDAKDRTFLYLKRSLPADDVAELRDLKLPGVVFEKEPARYYPNKNLAANVLGFVGVDNEGLAGIEYQFNEALSRDEGGFFAGHNVHLTINGVMQLKLEQLLQAQLEQTKSRFAVGIISEVRSGRILAMASLPNFDPNDRASLKAPDTRNRAIATTYEPGSTFKMFTMASVIHAGVLERERHYQCPGHFEYKGRRIGCPRRHGKLDLKNVIGLSCNTGVIEASWGLPILRFHEKLRHFGFGTRTGIRLPGEARGILHSPRDWDIYLKMSVPIGHGVSVTPIQLLMAANSLANGGRVLRPIIVDKVTSPEGRVVEKTEVKQSSFSVTTDTSSEILQLLKRAVSPYGTGYRANPGIKDLPICGKTGTSIKLKSSATRYRQLGGYLTGKEKQYQVSFLGFVPCDRPRISILVLFDEPQGALRSGGGVAAPVFRDAVKVIVPFMAPREVVDVKQLPELAYDRGAVKPGVMPNLLGKAKKEATRILWKHFPGEHQLSGRGYVVWQEPEAGSPVKKPFQFKLRFGFPNAE